MTSGLLRPGKRRLRAFAPPKSALQTGPIWIRPGHPFPQQLKLPRKPLPYLRPSDPKGWAINLRNQVVNREIMSARLEPPANGANVKFAFLRLNGAKQRVLKQPIELKRRFSPQKISTPKLAAPTLRLRALPAQLNCARRNIVTVNAKARFGPFARIVAGPTARNTHGFARQIPLRRKEIHETRRRRALFPRHVMGLITRFPVGLTHAEILNRSFLRGFDRPPTRRLSAPARPHSRHAWQ